MLIDAANKRAQSQVNASSFNHSPSGRSKFLITGQDNGRGSEKGMNQDESKATLANVDSIQRLGGSGIDTEKEKEETIVEASGSVENLSQPEEPTQEDKEKMH